MRIGLLSDVHGNAIALDVCLAALGGMGLDGLYFLGDAVGYLSGEVEVIERLEAAGAVCQLGNHEAMMLEPTDRSRRCERVYGLAAARARLPEETVRRIARWPSQRRIRVGSRRLLLVHGSPDDPIGGYVFPDADLAAWSGLPYDGFIMGHTHRPFVRTTGGTLFANVGSVGLPRNQGNLAAFGVYDSHDNSCRIVRLAFDVDAVLARYADASERVRACLRREATEAVFGERLA